MKMIKDIKKILTEYGINPSYHRMKIYEYLSGTKTHPTADTIYADMITTIPTLSRTTVYNTMKAFSEMGLITTVTIEDNEVRYDADISPHAHFKCYSCGGLHDIDLKHLGIDRALSSGKKIQGHLITEQQVYLRGICRDCQ